MKLLTTLFIVAMVFFTSCMEYEPVTNPDQNPPGVILTQPADGNHGVPVTTRLSVQYHEDIELASDYNITINNANTTASASSKTLNIDATLLKNTNYTIAISGKSVKDKAGNFASAFQFSFKTEDNSTYEAESAESSAGLSVQTSIPGFSGSAYIGNFTNANDYLKYSISDLQKGNYDLYVAYSTSSWGSKKCNIAVNGSVGSLELASSSAFNKIKYATVKLQDGTNEITITPDYTYFIIDYIQLIPNTNPVVSFNIDASLVTPNPSPQAEKLYTFLKDNFQRTIISGTMANYNTNIIEAQWVYDETGKWPALAAFDLIDYTRNWNWINYTELVLNGKNYWSKNGLVSLMWHWRDPSKTTDEFYTEKTDFDITRVNDVTSDEYKAMIEDMDVIAEYLKEFQADGVPILWRPLHEASGGWFWWGAKGPESCKALWILMFDRLVNHHGLDNLIWIWTTNADQQALNWYPGDEYVDILGMDIYPGENQHGSQYAGFDMVRNLFGGKKIITLSECGSVPDPKLMMEYGDTWSWFMPWNGDFTRGDKHNGSDWWKIFFSYDYVLTRDKMPNLK